MDDSKRNNIVSFPNINKKDKRVINDNKTNQESGDKDGDKKFQVFETNLVIFIKTQKILSYLLKTFFTRLFKIIKLIFNLYMCGIFLIDKTIAVFFKCSFNFLDFILCSIAKKTHGL